MRSVVLALVAGLVIVTVQNAQAFNLQGGNALWGKYAVQTCRSCHKEKGLTSLDPQERSREKWEAFFVDDYKKLKETSHDFAAMGINERQLENIHRYLVEKSGKDGSASTKTVASGSAQRQKSSSTTADKKKPSASSAQSGEKFDMAAGDAGKGRYIFRKCLNCHKKSGAPVISPGDRTKKAWGRFFSNDLRKLKKAMPKFDTYKYSISQLEHLHQFLVKYALDADKPKTCE